MICRFVTLCSCLFATNAFGTQWVSCDSPNPSDGVLNVSVKWLEGSLGPVGPVQVEVETSTVTKIIFYTFSENYPGRTIRNVGYFSDDKEIRFKLMDENFMSDRILLKFNRDGDVEGSGYVSISDLESNLQFSKIKLTRCETL